MADTPTTTPQAKIIGFDNFLVEKGFLTKENLIKARAESVSSRKSLFDYLVNERYITEEDITQARWQYLNED
jgi:hypothetical protein